VVGDKAAKHIAQHANVIGLAEIHKLTLDLMRKRLSLDCGRGSVQG
jgi:hypothetical protein